jgi:hypothetical protein
MTRKGPRWWVMRMTFRYFLTAQTRRRFSDLMMARAERNPDPGAERRMRADLLDLYATLPAKVVRR